MNSARSGILRAHLPRDLLAERHAMHEARRSDGNGGSGLPRGDDGLSLRGRAEMRSHGGRRAEIGQARTANEAVARGVGGIVAVHLADVFHAALIANKLRQTLDEPRAILGDQPGIGFQQLIHQLPAADAVVVRGAGPWQAAEGEDLAELLRDGRFRRAMRERVRREKHFAEALAAAAFENGLGQHPRRETGLDKFAVRDEARGVRWMLAAGTGSSRPQTGPAFPS